MRKTFVTTAALFSVLGIIFSVLPLDTLALLPLGIALVFSFLALQKSESFQKFLPKSLLIISLVFSIFVLGKTYLIKDEVAKDTQFEKQKVEANQEAKKDLEDLEKDLE